MTEPAAPNGPTLRSTSPAEPPRKSGVGIGALIGVGVAVVLLSFLAAFLGSSLANSTDDTPEAVATEEPAEPTPFPTEAYEEALAEILPVGSAVRVGTGAPGDGVGYEGDVYIDVSNANVYVYQDDAWTLVGNIRESAAANLTGATGAPGATGSQGEQGAQGEQGEQGEPGTQVLLGSGAPDDDTCVTDGDIYIDTDSTTFYECAAGAWTESGASAEQLPSD